MSPLSRSYAPVALTMCAWSALLLSVHAEPVKNRPRSRAFLFTYHATVSGLHPNQVARIWLPAPPTNADQEITIIKRDLPADSRIGKESKYGNHILYMQAEPNEFGLISLAVTYRVVRKEVIGHLQGDSRAAESVDRFLQPDAKVPIDGKLLNLLDKRELPRDQLQLGRSLYDIVNGHLRYSKEGTGWGQGDALWACGSGYGNCTDFHSLFIGLARSQKIPALFEIGFALPAKRGRGEIAGYHCWAQFKPKGKGWIPVDIAEANKDPRRQDYCFGNLTEDRVTFSVGRDLVLVPKQDSQPLNFFVDPYVEVDGKPYPAGKIVRKYTYEDVQETGN